MRQEPHLAQRAAMGEILLAGNTLMAGFMLREIAHDGLDKAG